MKKIFALLLTFVMVFSLAACSGNNSGNQNDSSSSSTTGNQSSSENQSTDATNQNNETQNQNQNAAPSGQLIVGSTTEPDSDFMTGWSSNATNQGIRYMIHGYSTVDYSQTGYVIDPVVVKESDVSYDDAGNKTYTFTLNDNLTWNDGTKITAKDYVFSMLLTYSPEFKELDTSIAGGNVYIGYEPFFAGETKTFEGVRLLGEYEFSLTIKAEELPYFFDLTYAAVAPAPMFVLAPGVDITDDGNGATLSDEFTTDLLRGTILDATNGYRYNPRITAGPYSFDGYDVANKSVSIVANPNFLGTHDGYTPSIERIIFKYVVQDTMMDALATGEVDLLTGINGGVRINAGLDLAEQGIVDYSTYLRAGYGKIAFHCDWSPTQFEAVRQALTYALDREEFARQFTGGFGIVVHGYYGASQWEYQQNRDFLEENLNHYPFNLETARDILIADGWTLNSNGEEFVEGTDDVRYKMVDGELMGLIIEWASTDGNEVSDLIATYLVPEAAKIGVRINQNIMDFPTLLSHYQRIGVEATYSMFNLATGFNPVIAPWYYYSDDPVHFGVYNSNFIANRELAQVTADMRLTDPQDLDGWSSKWVDMQLVWNQLMPDIPLYSDEYHDFFAPKLKGYTPDALWQWRYALTRAYVE